LGGVAMWQYFADCLGKTSNTFVSNAGIFGKVYFPRLIMPLSGVISNLVRFGIQLGLFVIVYVYYAIMGMAPSPNWYLLLFPVLLVMMAGLALGFGIIISSMTTKYRDLQILFSFFLSLWMYATPIVYPLSQVSGKKVLGFNLETLMCLNPVTPVIETFKHGALGAGEFIGWGWLAYSFGFMVVVLALGILIFNKVQKSFMDTV
jgi:lipopolysaccharide transport system permease protein